MYEGSSSSFPKWFVEESFQEFQRWRSDRWTRSQTRGALTSTALEVYLDTSPFACAAACASIGADVAYCFTYPNSTLSHPANDIFISQGYRLSSFQAIELTSSEARDEYWSFKRRQPYLVCIKGASTIDWCSTKARAGH